MSSGIEKLMELGKAYGWNVSDYEDRRTTENLDAMEMAEQEFRAALESALPKKAAADVLAERQRQISAEGWTAKHDDQHSDGSMALAAACYALNAAVWADRPKAIPQSDYVRLANPGYRWPWAEKWWKPKSQRQDLVRAAALLLAEIDRLDRAEAKGGAT